MKAKVGVTYQFVWRKHNTLSDDATKLGRPSDFIVTIRELKPSIGAGFIVALTGTMLTMPGLPKQPAALQMDVNEDGKAVGLF